MSYRIAHVYFPSGRNGMSYPANLYRADIRAGQKVMIWMVRDQALRDATVDRIDYRNVNCTNSIICTKAEHDNGVQCKFEAACGSIVYLPPDSGLHGLAEVWAKIEDLGWSEIQPTSKSWFKGYGADNVGEAGSILFRKNGIDILVERLDMPAGLTWLEKKHYQTKALNYYNNSGVDLFKHTVSFAAAFPGTSYNRETFLRNYGIALHPAKSHSPPQDRPHSGYSPITPNPTPSASEMAGRLSRPARDEYDVDGRC